MPTPSPAQENFALTLFTWIRISKKELYQSLPPDTVLMDSAELEYRCLKNQIAAFESTYRGAQPWLKGERFVSPTFIQNAERFAVRILLSIMKMQSILLLPSTTPFGKLWQGFFGLKGMPQAIFQNFAFVHINNNCLPSFAKKYPGLTAMLKLVNCSEPTLDLTLRSGAAVQRRSVVFLFPTTENISLGEQIKLLNRYWVKLKMEAELLVKKEENWPSPAESEAIELDAVGEIARRFVRKLCSKDRILLKKYQLEFKKILDANL